MPTSNSNGHGGPRAPSAPSPVSGPGALSRRTDGGPASQKAVNMGGLPYGENADFHDLQSQAPMSATPSAQPTSNTAPLAGPASMPVSFNSPTQNPQEPVTSGNPMGPGPGPEALSMSASQTPQLQTFAAIMPQLVKMADDPGTAPATRDLIRYLRSKV